MSLPRSARGFTLIELLTVIAIIAILMGLLFSAMSGVKDAGNKAKAKNDLTQIVTAVKAYQTEYGRYPVKPEEQGEKDIVFGKDLTNDNLLNVLRANGQGRDQPGGDNLNPRRIVFIEPGIAKPGTLRGGIIPDSDTGEGQFYDPWGSPYRIAVDATYDNIIANPYTNAGNAQMNAGVLAWSLGKDGLGGEGDKTKDKDATDDVLSWQ